MFTLFGLLTIQFGYNYSDSNNYYSEKDILATVTRQVISNQGESYNEQV